MRSLYRQHRNDEIKNYDENPDKDSTASLPDPGSKTPQLSQSN